MATLLQAAGTSCAISGVLTGTVSTSASRPTTAWATAICCGMGPTSQRSLPSSRMGCASCRTLAAVSDAVYI